MELFSREWLIDLLTFLPPLMLCLTVHEYAHARTAYAFGDPTAKNMGRLTLNPIAHIDPVGLLVLIFTQMIGWAKPVPVNPFNLHPRRLGEIAVSLAGPMSNLSLALFAGIALRVMIQTGIPISQGVFTFLRYLIAANVCLFVFNLLPIFPLDGHHIVREMLPERSQGPFMAWQQKYSMPFLALLLIGPDVANNLTGRAVFNPLDFIFSKAIGFVATVIWAGL